MPKPSQLRPHRHKAVRTRFLAQRAGIPYEMERVLCSECSRVLEERALRRAAA
jgi:NMD protein affecting ribosome stability and mRNA decay